MKKITTMLCGLGLLVMSTKTVLANECNPDIKPEIVSLSPDGEVTMEPYVWQEFVAVYSDRNSYWDSPTWNYQDLYNVFLTISDSRNLEEDIRLKYDTYTNTVSYLDIGSSSQWVGDMEMGGGGILQNSLMKLDLGTTAWVSGDGQQLYVPWKIQFKRDKSASINVVTLAAIDKCNVYAEKYVGILKINKVPTMLPPVFIQVGGTLPYQDVKGQTFSTGTRYIFKSEYRDNDGKADLGVLSLVIGDPAKSNKSVKLDYDHRGGTFWFYTYDGQNWNLNKMYEPKTSFVWENDYMIVRGPGSRVITVNAKTLAPQYAIEFKPAFAGRQGIFMQATDQTTGDTGLKWKSWMMVE